MLEYNGWVTLGFRDEATENETNKIYEDIKSKVDNLDNFNQLLHLRYFNGKAVLSIAGAANHKGSGWSDIFDLLNYISKSADRSYGVIYLRDDEDPVRFNSYQVFVVKKGSIVCAVDPHLTPCVPTIEDVFDIS
jgi:Immunity protein 7